MEDLYDLPELYDLVASPDPFMEHFYVEAVGGRDRHVLELACGTGRLTLPLAHSGAQVTGGDISDAMLARARASAVEQGLSIEFLELDMRNFDIGHRFDAVIVPANSLLHLNSNEDYQSFFGSVRRHLKRDGRLLFDIFVPSAQLLSLPADRRQALGEFSHAKLGTVTLEETISYDPITQVSRADWYWSTPAHKDFKHTPLELRQIYPQELPLLVERGGFQLVERFGGFDKTPLVLGSMRQVSICAPIWA